MNTLGLNRPVYSFGLAVPGVFFFTPEQYTGILVAFLSKVEELAASLGLPVMWPGVHADTPSADMWLEPSYFPNEHRDLIWDYDSRLLVFGFFQVSVYYRPGVSEGQDNLVEASRVTDQVIAHFPKGLNVDIVRVNKKPWQSSAIDLPGKSFIPVTISYRAIIKVTGY